MTCCTATEGLDAGAGRFGEVRLATSRDASGQRTLRLSVPGMHCGGCVAQVEKALRALPGIDRASANLTAKTVTVGWDGEAVAPERVIETIAGTGFEAIALDPEQLENDEAKESRDLLTRMAVAGFASANIMLLSVSVWAGANDATRDLLHWISALIALPTIIYSGRPFYVSALRGLRARRLNMDAPISLAVILATALSLSEVMRGGEDAYFDAGVMLLFLLLIGRWLDRIMRGKARSAARALARMSPRGAWVVRGDGERIYTPVTELARGDVVAIGAGERLPVDGIVASGSGTVDAALVTGESMPVSVREGDRLDAGVMSLDAALTVRATSIGEDTTLAEISRLCAAAEDRKSRLARLADRAAAIYAPVVHLVALAALLGWLAAGADFRHATMIAITVLIVTCPCALGLAAPMAQAVASGTLFRNGIMLKDGAALERLALIDRAVFDKTGVLTLGTLSVNDNGGVGDDVLRRAMGLAASSTHPIARAVLGFGEARGLRPVLPDSATETAGGGITGADGSRLGSAAFCGIDGAEAAETECWYSEPGRTPLRFTLTETLRPEAGATLAHLRGDGIALRVLSGDRPAAVSRLAASLGVGDWLAALRPEGKIAEIEQMQQEGWRVLMVGDGINDAPALAAASVSMAPASGSDIGRAAADLIFTGESLKAVDTAHTVARRTRRVILQNFGLAVAYNCVAIPVAILGYASPLVAAVAMSSSSLVVTANALRLARKEAR